MMAVRNFSADGAGRVRRDISIQGLLEWAFADECAQVDFEDEGTLTQGYGATGNAHRMAQRGALGCRIDGGGRSYPDADADLVASALVVWADWYGSRRMAVAVAELARARAVPDAMIGLVPRLVPVATRRNQTGVWAVTKSIGTCIDTSGRKTKRVDVRVCPVVQRPDAGMIAAARRDYLRWWSTLRDLRNSFQDHNDMSRWRVSDVMPPREPWKKILAE